MKIFARFLVPFAVLTALGTAACGGKKPEPQPQPVAETQAPAADAAAQPEADTAKAPEPDTAAAPAPDAAAAPAPDAAAAPAPDAAAAPAPDAAAAATADYFRVLVPHHDPAKPVVTAEFKTFKIVEANVDLTKLDTAKAVIEVDAASVSTGVDDRDTHVKSPDFLEVGKFASFTVTVDRLKAVENAADTYDAIATVDLRGIKKEVPVQFKVVEKKADGAIVVEGETKGLARADWGMALPPEKVGVAATLDAQLRLTLSNVAPAPAGEVK